MEIVSACQHKNRFQLINVTKKECMLFERLLAHFERISSEKHEYMNINLPYIYKIYTLYIKKGNNIHEYSLCITVENTCGHWDLRRIDIDHS